MYTIAKRFVFSASHCLAHLGEHHPCARLHGHNYEVEVQLTSEGLDARGFVVDYGDLAAVKVWLGETFDHRHLNDVLERPTAELIARAVYDQFHEQLPLVAVRVSETPKTWAEYRP